jgi:cytochrome oxidase Cu insertion factor (SCO1/SenC/PrrC family)
MRAFALLLALLLPAVPSPKTWHSHDRYFRRHAQAGFPHDGGRASRLGGSYRGKVVALFFGYTHCPDVCPATLANLTDMLAKVGGPDVRVLFVTVDPDRDTDAVMSEYANAFSPQVVGLRATPQCPGQSGPHLPRRL